jgi:DNA invertase Pin-like site-specific DNA recombinase
LIVSQYSVTFVICFKLDRLGRSLPHLAQIVRELKSHRVALVCPSQGIDTSGMNLASQLQLNILMAIAEFERSIIQERVSAGLRAARAKPAATGPVHHQYGQTTIAGMDT